MGLAGADLAAASAAAVSAHEQHHQWACQQNGDE
jgi:hypothetical protein